MKILVYVFFSLLALTAEADDSLCGRITITDGRFKINENEKTMICGSEQGVQGWQNIPIPQAKLHLKAILQNLGYLKPVFERSGDALKVTKGPQSEIKKFTVFGADEVLNPEKKRKVLKQALIPVTLNDVEAWANLRIRSQGYACPEIKVTAQTWDESVLVHTELNGLKKFSSWSYDDFEGLDPNAFLRYQPFYDGEFYDIRKAEIMTNRILADGLFQSAFFETTCAGDQAKLHLKSSIGKPRIVRFSIGAKTDEFPFVDILFKNARLDDQASSISSTLHFSPRLLSLLVESELYWIRGWHQTYIGPRLRLAREKESSYETDSGRVGLDIGHKWDLWNTRFHGRVGPTFNYVKTINGIGPQNATYPSLDSTLSITSHNYEAAIWQQYEGWTAELFFRGQGQGLGSNVNVNHYEASGKHLWNILEYDPPLFVLGTRFQVITVDATSTDEQKTISSIPVEDRVLVGGNENLRGFARKSINNQGLGYLSFIYVGFELRLIEELPYRVQPFLLADFGRVGTQRYTLDPGLFVSEGLGVRWLSPFGSIRGSAARGHVINANSSTEIVPQQWVYYFSFGQEF